MVAGCLLVALQPCWAQNASRKPPGSAAATRAVLVEKAQALEARGRPDMAAQLWQQILLSDPNNKEALEGLGRDVMLSGPNKAGEAQGGQYKANPSAAGSPRAAAPAGTHAGSAAVRQAARKEQPRAAEVAARPRQNEAVPAQRNAGTGRTSAESAAFAALYAKRLDEAEKRFAAILSTEPNDGRAEAGMGFVRMQQNNYADAISYLNKAEADGDKDRTVEDGLSAARFWLTMGQAAQAVEQNHYAEAEANYREALAMRPRSTEALNGLAGLLAKQQQYTGAENLYEQSVSVQPNSADGWRGLFLVCARAGLNQKALTVESRIPAVAKETLARDPEYLRALATIYQAENRTADAERVLAEALALPFADNGSTLKADTKLEYAGILTQAKHYDQAGAIYAQLLSDDAGNLPAWMGMINAHHRMGQDEQAIEDVKRMPPAAYEAAIGDPAFLAVLGAIYEQANQYEVAQGLLERAVRLQIAEGSKPGAALQLQLAGVYLDRKDAEHAYALYQQVLSGSPERTEAWKGLIAALVASNRNSEAVQQIAMIPAPVVTQLEADPEFVETELRIYAATGDLEHAVESMNRVQARYAKLHATPPAAIAIQNAWLLLHTQNDRRLYAELMRLGGRGDLTSAQRETVEDIWADWAVRRAAVAMENGNAQRAADILDAASQAFPDNMTVRKAVAGGYAQVGRAKESLALWKSIPMEDAAAGELAGAIGAALAANDRSQAEQWVRKGLERFPGDAALLSAAARYEQARGDNQRAADYYRASLASMPPATPQEKLAHVLAYPEQDTRAHRTMTAADLEQLLNPENEPLAKTTKVPPLPAYGPDPWNGAAPAGLAPAHPPAQPAPGPAQQQPAHLNPPSANRVQPPSLPVYIPQSWTRPRARIASQPLEHARSTGLGSQPDNRPRLLPATLVFSPHDRLHMRAGLGSLHTASFAPRALSAGHRRPRAFLAAAARPAAPQRSADAPRSQAADAWKDLIYRLMAGNRSAEAVQKIGSIPPDVRAELEADVEFVQAEANLYVSVGDIARGAESLNRVENLYVLRRSAAPAGVLVEHAFLLDNLGDDQALRPLIERIRARADLTASQRRQMEALGARSAARRAGNEANSSATSATQSAYAGRMKLTPTEETVDSTGPVSSGVAAQSPRPAPLWNSGSAAPAPGLRITSQPMGPVAAQAQALFADQTDGQLTQGSAAAIHNAPNSPVGAFSGPQAAPTVSGQYNVAQYTPSAQDAATGAYSAPRQQSGAAQPAAHPPAKPAAAHRAVRKRRRATVARARASQPATPLPVEAPAQPTPRQEQTAQQVQATAETPAAAQASTTDTGLTDEELQQRNLPPLRGPWIRFQRQGNPVSPRDEAEMQLRSIEAGYSPWLGGAGVLNYRSGSLGFDRLAALEAPFEASMPLGLNSRVSLIVRPVFLDSGQADGSSLMTVQGVSSPGSPVALINIPQPIGSLMNTAAAPPAQQSAVGIGGEVQMTFPHVALAGGYTPEGFLVSTFTGRARLNPGNGPFTLNLSREPVRDTQLSYAGLRDPNGATPGSPGQVWGGVMANQGEAQFVRGDVESGF